MHYLFDNLHFCFKVFHTKILSLEVSPNNIITRKATITSNAISPQIKSIFDDGIYKDQQTIIVIEKTTAHGTTVDKKHRLIIPFFDPP